MTKKQNPKAKDALSKNPDYKDIVAIVEGRFGKPVKRSGNFINANYPPDDVSQEQLERIWGDPKDVRPLREMVMREKKKAKTN
jgi:hypothetical protein